MQYLDDRTRRHMNGRVGRTLMTAAQSKLLMTAQGAPRDEAHDARCRALSSDQPAHGLKTIAYHANDPLERYSPLIYRLLSG